MLPQDHLGVDRADGRWVAVGYGETDRPGVAVYDDIDALWADNAGAERVVVGVPVGLLDEADDYAVGEDGTPVERRSRACDRLARDALPERGSTVVPAPGRQAVRAALGEDATRAAASEVNRRVTGRGLSAQAASLAPAVAAVDDLLTDGAGDPEVVVEGHPEVCFQAFAVDDVEHSKHTAVGVLERQVAFRGVDEYGHGDWTHLVRELDRQGENTGLDDLLDATALALTAAADAGERRRLPPGDDPPRDAHGLPMQTVYRRDTPVPVVSGDGAG